MKKYNYKNQTGAISYFVMMAMLFFLFTIVGVYTINSKRAQTQTESLELAKEKYYSENATDVYNRKLANSSDIIPIYTKEQLWAIGTGATVEIDGRIYNFSESASYELKNDIIINVSEYNSEDLISGINKNNYEVMIYGDQENVSFPEIKQGGYYHLAKDEDNQIVSVKSGPDYGTEVSDMYTQIYTNIDPYNPITKKNGLDTHINGNFLYPKSLESNLKGKTINNTTTNNPGHAMIYAGNNTINFNTEVESNSWIKIKLSINMGTGSVTLSDLELIFADGTINSLNKLIENEYVEPLVIASASSEHSGYLFSNFTNIISGGQTTGIFSTVYVFFKVKDKSNLTGINITSSKTFETKDNMDGINITKYPQGTEISTVPFKVR